MGIFPFPSPLPLLPQVAATEPSVRLAPRVAWIAFAAVVAGFLLVLFTKEGVSLEGLARAYGIHRATIARWLATARADVLERTRQALSRLIGARPDEIDSLLRAARSQLRS